MKIRHALAAFGAALTTVVMAAPAPSDEEGPLPDAKRMADEKNAADAAVLAWQALEAANPKHLPAFPGAEGFGALVTGGRGGEIVHVTNLADAGTGSFRAAVSKPNRLVVFDVGGTITLQSNVEVGNNTTILGQTAPGEGICLYNRGVSLSGKTNIIVRYLRFRAGLASDAGKKSLGMDKSSNMIIDHCSIEWGRWDDLGITVGSTGITVQYCLIAEAIHPQSFGALIDTVTNITLSHNLWLSNESRNPKVKGTIQYINNVVYNWGGTGLCGGHSGANHDLDVINNYFIAGPSSNDQFAGQFYATDHVYQEGNLVDLNKDGQLNGILAQPGDFHREHEKTYTLPTFVPAPAMRPAVAVTVDSASAAFAKIVVGVGCSLHRDSVDLRLISELTSLGTQGRTLPQEDKRDAGADAKAKDAALALSNAMLEPKARPRPASTSPNLLSRLYARLTDALKVWLSRHSNRPLVDSDKDGISDGWETAHLLDPKNSADAAMLNASGYQNIEVYANGLAAP